MSYSKVLTLVLFSVLVLVICLCVVNKSWPMSEKISRPILTPHTSWAATQAYLPRYMGELCDCNYYFVQCWGVGTAIGVVSSPTFNVSCLIIFMRFMKERPSVCFELSTKIDQFDQSSDQKYLFISWQSDSPPLPNIGYTGLGDRLIRGIVM